MEFKLNKKIIIFFLSVIALFLFFTYKLVQIPPGVTIDESAFGYNAVLISRTLHDENHRALPLFVLSIHGTDWRQPVTQYFAVLLFKILGPSLYNLRLTAVITAIISVFLVYFLARETLGKIGGVLAGIFMIATPIFMIQSHLALDNIAPIPFVIIWLLGLFLFTKSKKYIWLIISAISLGIGFYSYKGMRIYVPIWAILSELYLAESFLAKFSKKSFSQIICPVLVFGASIFPFFAIIPYLETRYAGAVLSGQHPEFPGIYKFAYPYLASFDPSFLWVKGDEILIHSTGKHGMYLLATIPFFIIGLVYFWKKGSYWKFIISSFFLGPLLFGLFGSVDRASRMLAEVPLYSLICSGGFLYLWEAKKKVILGIFTIIFALNYLSFISYYWTEYAQDTNNLFYCFDCANMQYKKLSDDSRKRKLVPYVDSVVLNNQDTTGDFAESVYFTQKLPGWDGKEKDLPKNTILMTNNDHISFLKLIGKEGYLFYYTY